MKIIAIVLAVGLIVFSAALAVNYNASALSTRKDLDQERYLRMVAEEKLERTGAQIRKLESELSRVEREMKGVQDLLDQSQEANDRLQTKLDGAAAVKEALERKIEELQQALTRQTTVVPAVSGDPT